MARQLKIHPSIGVARVGNSPDEYFIGPERPGEPERPEGGYRDGKKRVKRQGARFRVFVYDDGTPPRELTAAEATVEWSVRLANKKSAADRFHGVRRPNEGLRNPQFARDQLVLEAAAGPVAGPNARAELVSTRPFMDKPLTVTLGRLHTDAEGRLIVLGGHGTAGSPINTPLEIEGSNFANREGWYDDVSDGPVTARVTMRDGSAAPAVAPAWVLVGPPKFAPTLQNPVTLYDTLRQVAINRGMLPDPSKTPNFKPSFRDDIAPIVRRALGIRWVYAGGESQAPAEQFHFFTASPRVARRIFPRLRRPSSTLGAPGEGNGDMPRNWSDDFPDGGNGTLTPLQYAIMKAWSDGNFNDDSSVPAEPVTAITPDGLDRAALESCVGAPMYPGIEVSWNVRDQLPFVEPFRLDAGRVNPGEVTWGMGVPWQSDFIDCSAEAEGGVELTWWPAQRPVDVWQSRDGESQPWARSFVGANPGEDMEVDELVTAWYRLGFVLADGEALFEVDRVDHEVP